MGNSYLKLGKAVDLADKKDRLIYRFFEILPGFLAWSTLITVVILSFIQPVAIAVFIIIFDVYWLVKTVYLALHLRVAFKQMRLNMKINWLEALHQLPATSYQLPATKSWQDIYHLIILPTYKEGAEVVGASLDGLLNANYPKNRIIVVISQEERAGKDFNLRMAEEIISKYQNQFLKLMIVEHPVSIPGELAGKGSNIAWAGRFAKREIIDALGISYDRVLVSALDIDTVVFPEYFGRLTYTFLISYDPLHSSYQPVPFYTNNIWEAPSFARVVAFSSTFWHTIKQERMESDTTFSSHSMPLTALIDVDFWQNNMVSEDSRIFWQCFLRYDGRYQVVPLYYPVSMDANVAPTFWQTMVNVYKQQRRWGYGAENVPYFLFGFYKNKAIGFGKKIYLTFTMLERFWSWATNAIMIFLLGWLPVIVGGNEFNKTVLSFNLPFLTRLIMTFAMLGLITSAILTIFILPPRPLRYGKFKHVWMILQWILFPATTIFLGSLPGLEAQTRLMLGKYMGFWVTPKTRLLEFNKEL
ncbi:MAG: glycosyltransferase family 2 protein [Candidatus Yanofskybacteria bacterium]|nr:glycosyltransferase family 2 protein [Candidatus Yanofskybacteria bacterium]